MNGLPRTSCGGRDRASGAALVIGLLLATTVAMLAVHALSSAALGLRMAANLEYRDRAMEAAEYGILDALASPGLDTAATPDDPVTMPSDGGTWPSVPGSTGDKYSYRLHFAGESPAGPGLVAYHFVVESNGRSLRGASVTLIQGFRVVAPQDAASLDGLPRLRSYWMQTDAD